VRLAKLRAKISRKSCMYWIIIKKVSHPRFGSRPNSKLIFSEKLLFTSKNNC